MSSIYFSHPIRTYATPEALEVLWALQQEYPNYKIIDPEDYDTPLSWKSCKQCMDEHMKKIVFPMIEICEKFAIWAPIKTCGVHCELTYASQLGKPCIYISNQFGEIDFEDITLQDYHRVESQTLTEEVL